MPPERQREFSLISKLPTTGIEEGDAEKMKASIADKLALGSLQRIGRKAALPSGCSSKNYTMLSF
jgi:hypothetical protein